MFLICHRSVVHGSFFMVVGVTIDTYAQAVTDDKRKAQSRVVKMFILGNQRAMLLLVDISGRVGNQSILQMLKNVGVPYGSRTRVAAVKGRCPRPLDERDGP